MAKKKGKRKVSQKKKSKPGKLKTKNLRKVKFPKSQIAKDIEKTEEQAEKILELQNKHHWKPFIISVIIVFAVAALGNLFTAKVVDTPWYESIRPALTPPNWVFPVVWNILFFLIAVSLYLSWIHSKKDEKKIVAGEFGVNLFLNALWSFLFFGLKSPLFAFVCLIFLWVSIISMIYVTWKINRKASYALVPYLLWVSFAGVLNFLIIT